MPTDVTPKRIQRKRTKGWRKPENTVIVDRTSRWGNPFVGYNSHAVWAFKVWLECPTSDYYTAGHIVTWLRSFREVPEEGIGLHKNTDPNLIATEMLEQLSELRGKNLACFCSLDKPCHADVLLELANKEA